MHLVPRHEDHQLRQGYALANPHVEAPGADLQPQLAGVRESRPVCARRNDIVQAAAVHHSSHHDVNAADGAFRAQAAASTRRQGYPAAMDEVSLRKNISLRAGFQCPGNEYGAA